ncbi:MAG: hypothetical protein JWM05_2097 [Acidimicrobiales bacterium]|nr:hypothetical protein [Acidimicrobiales bacterium]
MHEATRRRLFLVARVVFGVAIIAVLVLAATRSADDLRKVDFELSPGWLLAAAPFTFAGGILLPLAWRQTLGAYGVELPRAKAVRVWCLSQASRFIPGNVALVASRVLLSSREGVPRSLAAGSLALEGGMIVVWGGFFASWLPSSIIPWPLRLLMAGGALTVLVGLPVLLRVSGRVLSSRFPALAPESLRPRRLYEAVGLYGLNNLVRACGFVLVAAALHTIDPRDVWLIIAAVNLGALVGMIGITPAGLGVREVSIAALLVHRFEGNAAAFAVAFRAWDFAFELVWLGLALWWERRFRQRADTTATP